jgi:hypothetical protein
MEAGGAPHSTHSRSHRSRKGTSLIQAILSFVIG